MKKLLILSFLFALAVTAAQAQVALTVAPGGIVMLTNTSEHEVTLTSPYTLTGCVWVICEVITGGGAGPKISAVTVGTASPITWTAFAGNAAGSKTYLQYCITTTYPYQPAVKIRIIGSASDVIKFHFGSN